MDVLQLGHARSTLLVPDLDDLSQESNGRRTPLEQPSNRGRIAVVSYHHKQVNK